MAQIIYGVHPVREALKSQNLVLEKIVIGTQHPHAALQSILDLAKEKNVPVTSAREDALDQLARGGRHQNVVGVLEDLPYLGIREILSLSKEKGGKALILVLDGIQDPQNFGSLIRTALGCGAQGLVIPKHRAVGVTPTVIKASAGATAHLPIARVVNVASALETLKEEGIWVYGASGEARDRIYNLDLTLDVAIVIGAEGKGIRPLVKQKCDRLFSIPMKGPVFSFNASVSGGMILYEVMRQRYALPETGGDHDSR